MRSRSGLDEQRVLKHPAYVEMERLALSEFGLGAMSHRTDTLGWRGPMPPHRQVRADLPVRAIRIRPVLPGLHDGFAHAHACASSAIRGWSQRYLPRLTSLDFDALAQGAMFMTEQAAGSDIAATATQARRDDQGDWRLYGDKWFCSNPDADLAMVLARAGRRTGGPEGRVALPAAAPPARRLRQPLPHHPPERQAGHPLDGQRRDPPGRRGRVSGG